MLFGAGLLIARFAGVERAGWLFVVSAALGIGAALAPRAMGRAALAAAMLFAGAGWWGLRLGAPPADSLARALGADEAIVEVQGVIASRPRLHEPVAGRLGGFARSEKSVWFWLATHRARSADGAWSEVSGSLWVRMPAATDDLRMGDVVRVLGRAGGAARPFNPGAPGPEWAREEHRAGFLAAPERALVTMAPPEEVPGLVKIRAAWLRFVGAAQSRALAWTDGAAPSSGRALMASLLVGEREPGLDEVRESFTNAGMAHILAISGMHLTILAWTATLGLRLLGEPGRWEAPIVLGAVLLYVVIVPAGAPVVRAAIMTVGMLVAQSAGRRYDRINILGWTMLAALLWRPLELWSAGFQLSFACVGALLWLAPALRARWFIDEPDPDEHGPLGRLMHKVRDALCASVAAWVVSIPIVMFHFGAVPLLSVPASLIGLPLATLALGAGYASVVVGALIPGAGALAGMVITPIGSALAWIAALVDALPFATLRTPPITIATALAMALVGAWWLRWGSPRMTWPRLRFVAAAALALGMIGLDARAARLPRDIAWRVDTLAVGDGTCHLLRGGAEALLWDCGSSSPGVGVHLIPGAARELGAWRVRTVVISHPNLDHFAGLLDIVEPLGVRRVVVGEAFAHAALESPAGAEATALGWLAERGVFIEVISSGHTIELGSARLEFLAPRTGERFEEANDASFVARLVDASAPGQNGFLFTGDIERPGMSAIESWGVDVRAAVMEAPHHGSAAGGAPVGFVESVSPLVIVQSTGAGRVGDERWAFARPGRVWWTTAADGAVWVESARGGSLRTGTHSDPRASASLIQLGTSGLVEAPPALSSPRPANDTVGRESPVSNSSSGMAPGAR